MSTVTASVQIIIGTTTAAVAAATATTGFYVDARGATLAADALAGSEEVTIEYRPGAGTAWGSFYDEGVAVKLTATKPHITITGRGQYRVAKTATVSSCGVYVVR